MPAQATKNASGKRKSAQRGVQQASSDDESEDISVVGNSLSVSVNSVRQLIRAVLTGTKEDILCNECSLVFECKLCKNLFRSVANFISHKRRYCKKSYSHFTDHDFFIDELDKKEVLEPCSVSVVGENEANSPKENGADDKKSNSRESKKAVICRLEEVPHTNVAKYQTVVEEGVPQRSMQQELEHLAEVSTPQEVFLSRDGQVMHTKNKSRHKCSLCDKPFSTAVTLKYHLAYAHRTRTCYLCPICKSYCSTPWAVYRHLSKIHNKSTEQVRKFRATVLSKPVKRQLHQVQPQVLQDSRTRGDSARTEDEKWRAEYDGTPTCSVCGKTFTRNAAREVHSRKCKIQVKTKQNDKELDILLLCDKCGKQFARKSSLRVHQQSCKFETHSCKHCKKVFSTIKEVEVHNAECLFAPRKSPIQHLLTPTKYVMSKVYPSSPSDIQVRMDYKIPSYRLSLPVLPAAPKLENVVQKLRERPLFSNETVSTNQNPSTSRRENVLKRVSVPLVNVAQELDLALKVLNASPALESNDHGSSQESHVLTDDCLPDVTAPPFHGFESSSQDDRLLSSQIKAMVKKFDGQLRYATQSVCNGIIVGKNHSLCNGIIDKQRLLVDESFL